MTKNIKYYPRISKNPFHFDHVHIRWDQQVPLHQQETWELSYIITGSGARIIGNVLENFNKGEVILIPPNIPHCWSFEQNNHDDQGKIENITIVMDDHFLKKAKELFPELSTIVAEVLNNHNAVSFSGPILERLQNLMKAMITESEIERIGSFFRVLELISHAKDMHVVGRPIQENKKEKKLQEIHLYVLGNYQQVITLDEIAKAVGMQRSSFCVFFKKMTGKSFFTHLTEFRVEASCQMLLKTSLSVAEICLVSGFNDVPYYNRVFRKIKKTTPVAYRLSMKKTDLAELKSMIY
ncbi:AraC family transcriptional regulator [Pedobacter nutrimenti]|uniref:AraC-like DNA-binding protein n=1 Tax=Pedobacter nutrimenti TaxID=1241337 RepID=A0A318UBS2_9SPHI|nr:AraC family transcriptional regulator [Pedobacter nutrimenti]PYF73003.1 AraC-like DNA-binding protein [Pedobacter nutrimenti]